MNSRISRREFLQSAAFAGAAILTPLPLAAESSVRRTAADQVALGKTGVKLSRLGIGAGSNSGEVQRGLGREGFNRLIRHAYDQGITYLDTAQSYQTHEWIRDAIKGLPREKLFIQSKMPGGTKDPMEAIDRYRKEMGVDYIDSLLVHCMVKKSWCDDQKRVMDVIAEAQERKIIRVKGVSCHSLPALSAAAESDWVNVNLVRVNPQCKWVDGPGETWNESGDDIAPVMKQVKTAHANGHGIIGMKMIGNGEFTKAEDREKAIRYAMAQPEIDAVVIGFKSPKEIDEAIERINRALRELA